MTPQGQRRFWPAFVGTTIALTSLLAFAHQPAWAIAGFLAGAAAFSLTLKLAPSGRRDHRYCAAAVGTVVAVLAGSVTAGIAKLTEPPPSYTEQEILASARDDGLALARDTTVDNPMIAQIRPDGPATAIFHFSPDRIDSTRPDQIEVYERVQDRFRPKLKFRPAPTPDPVAALTAAASSGAIPDKLGPGIPKLVLHAHPTDLDGRAGKDLLVDLLDVGAMGEPRWPRPLVLSWSSESGAYLLTPLISTDSIEGKTPRDLLMRRFLIGPGDVSRHLMTLIYEQPTTLRNELTGDEYPSVYPSEVYLCTRETVRSTRGPSDTGLVLTSGYVVRSPAANTPDLLQVIRWHIRWSDDGTVSATAGSDTRGVLRVGIDVSRLDRVIRRAKPSGPRCTEPAEPS